MILCQPHRKDVELAVAGKHGVERGKIAQRLFHDLRPRIDEDAMHGGRNAAQLVHAVRGHKEAKRELALRLFVERADDIAQVIDLRVGGARSCAGFKRGRVVSAHHARQHADFEERDELLLRVDLAARGGGGLGPPRRQQDAVAIERHQSREQAGPRRLRRRLQRKHLDVPAANGEMVAVP